ncbi:MAG: RraA family protein, partial [Pseudolabrys sp.]|nr:RraA family protein [Pseudolabrys sp.]
VVDYGVPVNIHGMAVRSNDLIHADQHGAVVVPIEIIDAMQEALPGLSAKEAKIINAAKSGAGLAAIKAAMKG